MRRGRGSAAVAAAVVLVRRRRRLRSRLQGVPWRWWGWWLAARSRLRVAWGEARVRLRSVVRLHGRQGTWCQSAAAVLLRLMLPRCSARTATARRRPTACSWCLRSRSFRSRAFRPSSAAAGGFARAPSGRPRPTVWPPSALRRPSPSPSALRLRLLRARASRLRRSEPSRYPPIHNEGPSFAAPLGLPSTRALASAAPAPPSRTPAFAERCPSATSRRGCLQAGKDVATGRAPRGQWPPP